MQTNTALKGATGDCKAVSVDSCLRSPEMLIEYLKDSCGRCALGCKPDCKVHPWAEVLRSLRAIVLQAELVEVIKWEGAVFALVSRSV